MGKTFMPRARITLEVTATLNEIEVRALDALVGYGIDPFLKVFYEKLGKHYMEPHEKGLRSLFKTINSEIQPGISKINKARSSLESDLKDE